MASTWALATASKRRRTVSALSAGLLLAVVAGSGPCAATSAAEEVYLPQQEFLDTAFGGAAPQAQLLWLTGELRGRVSEVLGHAPSSARLRYWHEGSRSAWVLDEIGKERPITVGIVVDGGRIADLKILVYRESRGWEVRHDFFTNQFDGAVLAGDDALDRSIDNISGATLSVGAVSRLARMALLLDRSLNTAVSRNGQ